MIHDIKEQTWYILYIYTVYNIHAYILCVAYIHDKDFFLKIIFWTVPEFTAILVLLYYGLRN